MDPRVLERTKKFIEVSRYIDSSNNIDEYDFSILDKKGLKVGRTIVTDEGISVLLDNNIMIRIDEMDEMGLSGEIIFENNNVAIFYSYIFPDKAHNFMTGNQENASITLLEDEKAIKVDTYNLSDSYPIDINNINFISILRGVENIFNYYLSQEPIK